MPSKSGKTETIVEPQSGSTEPASVAASGSASKHRSKGYSFAVALVVVLLLFAAIVGGVLYKRSFRVAQIGGITVSAGTSREALASQLEQLSNQYRMTVSYPNGTSRQVSLKKLGITVNAGASADAAIAAQKQSDNIVKRAQWWGAEDVKLVVDVNDKKLESALQKTVTKSSKKPVNAKVTIKNGRAKLVEEKVGTGFTVAGGREDILYAAQYLITSPLSAQNLELKPAITKAEANPVYEQTKAILAQKVVLNIDNRPVTVPATAIGKWIELTPVASAKTIDLSVNSGKVLKYINEVAAPYVQPPRSEVVLKKSGGGTQVLVPGKSGVDVVRKNELATNVAKKVLAGEGVNANASIKYAAFKRINARSYPKWLVVDVTNKRMYAYENTKLVRTFLISAGAPQTPTVLGQYAIRSKIRRQDMRGNNVDGSRYFQPNVEYVNYFYADYAIHGNYWRPTSYFGNVNSSHGCVGIRNPDAAWIYGWAPIGTPVIVHS